MRTLAVLPVKSFTAAKARLAARLGPAARAELAEAMLGDVLEALASAGELDGVAVVTAEARAAAAATEAGAEVVPDVEQAGQSPAAVLGASHAIEAGYDRLLLVPGDTPLLEPGEIDELIVRSARARLGAAIVPDRHRTGTNALLLHPADALAPRFGPDSLARHVAAARQEGLGYAVEPVTGLEHDVDTREDLDDLGSRLRERPGAARRTRGTAALSSTVGA